MDEDLPITELLRRAQTGDQDALTKLTEHFFELARKIALQQLAKYPPAVREDAGRSIIGIEGLRSALSYLGRIEKEIANRNEFFVLLRTVIRNKIADVARHESERIKRRADLGDYDPEDRGATPLEELVQKETDAQLANLANRVTTLIYETEDKIKLMVGVLGVLKFYSATQIQQAVASEYPDEPLLAKSTILEWLRKLRRRLARELDGEFGNE